MLFCVGSLLSTRKSRENYNDHVKRLILWPTEVVHNLALVSELYTVKLCEAL